MIKTACHNGKLSYAVILEKKCNTVCHHDFLFIMIFCMSKTTLFYFAVFKLHKLFYDYVQKYD